MPDSSPLRGQQTADDAAWGPVYYPPISPARSSLGLASTQQHPLFLGIAPYTSEAALFLAPPRTREWTDQLRVSKTIFLQLIRRSSPQPEWPRELFFTSANGDVQADIAMANYEWRGGNQTFLELCQKVYGVTNMETGSKELPVDSEEAGSHRNPYPFFAAQVPRERANLFIRFPALKLDMDMVAILDARGTVILNLLFHGTEEQRAIIKLADAAMTIWKMWADARPEPEPKCVPLNNPRFRRYHYMLPLIREDVHLRLQHCVDKLPGETKSKYHQMISMMYLRINIHRNSSNGKIREDSKWYIQNETSYLSYTAGMDEMRTEVERMVNRPDTNMDIFLASLKHYADDQAPVNERSGFLGGTEAAHIDVERWANMFKNEQVPTFGGMPKRGRYWFLC